VIKLGLYQILAKSNNVRPSYSDLKIDFFGGGGDPDLVFHGRCVIAQPLRVDQTAPNWDNQPRTLIPTCCFILK